MSRLVPTAPPASHARLSGPRIIGLGALVPLLPLAVLVQFEFANWDKITPGVTAVGTPIGGLSRAEAASTLAPGVRQLLDRPLDIRGADQTWHTTARDLGLRLDPNELVSTAYEIGRHGSPIDRLGVQLDTLAHGRTVSTASTTDRTALETSLASMARQIERAPTDARLSLGKDGSIQSSPARDGLAVDIRASRDRLTAALNKSDRSVELATSPVPPAVPDQQLQTAREQLDQLLGPTAEPLTATFGDKSWRLERPDLVKLVSLSGGTRPGQPAIVKIDDAQLHAWAGRLAKDIDQAVQDARFSFNGGNLKTLRASRQGRSLDQDATVKSVHDALLAGDRTVALPVSLTEPAVSSDDSQALGITELIDRGQTSFAGSIPEKKANIQLAARRLHGVVVPPGGTFSFNRAIGPTTIDAGFQWGFGITSGDNGPKTVPAVAGGICQVATTLFQPVFWSGYQLEERYWHLYWIPAYTSRGIVGLDVTVDSDSGLDFKWTNPTPNYVLVQADADDEHIYFGLYGKKPTWKVQVDDAVITNRVPPDPKPIAQEEPTLPWGRTLLVETARDGFDAHVTRRVLPTDGGSPRELNLKSTYQPAHTVTLVGSRGKPPEANINEVIQRIREGQKTPEPKPSPTAGAAAPAPNPTGQPTTTPAQAPAPTPTPQPPSTTQTPAPKPTPKPLGNTDAGTAAIPPANP